MGDVKSQQLRLLAATAHDLKTPLTFIKGAASEWQKPGMSLAMQAELIRRVEHSADRLLKLIDSLIGGAMTEQLPLKLEPVGAGDVIAQAHQDIKAYAEELGFHFDIKLKHNLPPILSHRLSLRRILFNLMDNAIKYSQNKRRVEISAHRLNSERVAINIRDYGVGLNKTDLGQIFKLYGRAAEPTNAASGSSGLGLFIASQLADSLAAELSVRPNRIGTTFSIRLPVAHQLSLFA